MSTRRGGTHHGVCSSTNLVSVPSAGGKALKFGVIASIKANSCARALLRLLREPALVVCPDHRLDTDTRRGGNVEADAIVGLGRFTASAGSCNSWSDAFTLCVALSRAAWGDDSDRLLTLPADVSNVGAAFLVSSCPPLADSGRKAEKHPS